MAQYGAVQGCLTWLKTRCGLAALAWHYIWSHMPAFLAQAVNPGSRSNQYSQTTAGTQQTFPQGENELQKLLHGKMTRIPFSHPAEY